MATVGEAIGAKTPMASDLAEGVDTLDLNAAITFTRYVRLVLPFDGFVFWVRANLVTPSALFNHALLNRFAFNQFPRVIAAAAPTLVAKGSLHYATDVRQEAGETYAANRIVFTSEQAINDLSAIAPGTLWLGEFEGKRFAFSSRSSFYQQADLFHYVGFAVYPDMATQIIDTPMGFDARSLPAPAVRHKSPAGRPGQVRAATAATSSSPAALPMERASAATSSTAARSRSFSSPHRYRKIRRQL